MSILAAIFAGTTKRETSDWKNPRLWNPISHFAYSAGSGVTVTDETSLTLPGYLAAIRNISDDIAKVPLLTYRARSDRGKDRAKDHPVYQILHATPNREQTSIVFRSLMSAYAMHSGNAVAEITTDGAGRVRGLWPIHPYRLEIKRNQKTRDLEYHVKPPPPAVGPPIILPPEDVIHVPGFGFDGIAGMPLLRLAAEAIGLGLAAQQFGGAFFRNGTTLSGYIKYPGALATEKDQERLKTSWRTENSGLDNAFGTPVLEKGAEWVKMGVPPEEAQFVQTRQFQIEEVARVLRIAPHKLQHLIKATHSNIESLETAYVNDSLLPWFIRWEQEIFRKLFPREPDLFCEHLVEGLLRGTPVQRAAYYRQMFGIGVLNQNDIREKENLNPIGPEGDVYYVPSNMTRSEDAAKGIVASSRNRGPGGPDNSPRDPNRGNDGGGENANADVTGALRIVFFDAIRRICRAEDRALDRAIDRYSSDENGWAQWLSSYTGRHGEFLAGVLEAPAAAYGRAWGLEDDQVAAGIERAAETITADFRDLAALRRDGGGVDENHRVATLAAAIFEGLDHVDDD